VASGAGWFFQLALLGQLGLPLLLLLDAALRRSGKNLRLLRFVTHFYSMNAALLVGYWQYLRGIKTTIWRPTQRYQQG
jgi:hypothetical protein